MIGQEDESLQIRSDIPNLIVSMDTKVLNFRIFPFAKNTCRVKSTLALSAPLIPGAGQRCHAYCARNRYMTLKRRLETVACG